MSISALTFILIAILISFGVPIAASITLSAIIALIFLSPTSLNVIPIMMSQGLNSFLLLALPMFMLVGKIMEIGGSSRRIFNFANSLVGWVHGGIGIVTVTASMIFGGISGSSVADAGSLGRITTKAMQEYGFPPGYASALAVSSSTLAVIIPPSILLVLYGVSANQSVGTLLAAGLLPGIIIGIALMIVNYIIAKKNNWKASHAFSIRNVIITFKKGILALITPIILLGGIFSGIFTATEGAAIAVVYCIFISYFIYKDLTLKDLWIAIKESARDSSVILFLLAGASLVSHILTIEQIPHRLATYIIAHSPNDVVTMTGIVVLLLIAGMFLDPASSIVILVPIFLPIAISLGYSPVHFGVIFIGALAIGLITPPVAPCLLAICRVTGLQVEDIFKDLIKFIITLIIVLILLVIFKDISLLLPRLFFDYNF